MAELTAPQTLNYFIPAGQYLTVVAATPGVGTIDRLADAPGGTVSTSQTAFTAGETKTLGPWATSRRYSVSCTTGTVTSVTVGLVELGVDATEAALIDGVTAGTVVVSKAAVYDSAGKLKRSSASPAAAGNAIGNATAMTAELNIVTGADGTKGVKLPVATADSVVEVVNSDTSNNLLCYPAAAGSTINALGDGAAITITPGQALTFIGRSATAWYAPTATDTVTGLTSSAAELNLNDGATTANSVASKTAVLDSSKSLRTTGNPGTVNTGVTAVDYGDGRRHLTVLTVSQASALTLGDDAALADGYKLYDFPAGAIVVNAAYMSMGVTNAEHAVETPDVGLGMLIGSGANATLQAVGATAENVLTGQTAADTNGTATVKTVGDQVLVIAAGDSHALHFNVAATWANTAGAALDADIAGTVVIDWTLMA